MCVFPIVSIWELMTPPGQWQIFTPQGMANFDPEAWWTGFIKGPTRHCYTQNTKALSYVALENKIFLCFSHSKYIGANDCQGGVIFDPRGMIGNIYVEYH